MSKYNAGFYQNSVYSKDYIKKNFANKSKNTQGEVTRSLVTKRGNIPDLSQDILDEEIAEFDKTNGASAKQIPKRA